MPDLDHKRRDLQQATYTAIEHPMTRSRGRRGLEKMSLIALALAACGCGGEDFSDKCAFACTPPSGLCEQDSQRRNACEEQCLSTTDGQSDECSQCIVDEISWTEVTCTCENGSCYRCTEDSSSDMGFCNGTDIVCDEPTDNTCTGFDLPATSDRSCRDQCAP